MKALHNCHIAFGTSLERSPVPFGLPVPSTWPTIPAKLLHSSHSPLCWEITCWCAWYQSFSHPLYFGPQTLNWSLYFGNSYSGDLLYYSLIFLSPSIFSFSFFGTPGSWMFDTSIAALIYLPFLSYFPSLWLLFNIMLKVFYLLWGQFPQTGVLNGESVAVSIVGWGGGTPFSKELPVLPEHLYLPC